MRFRWNLSNLQSIFLRIALLALAVASVITAILDVPAAWQTPFVLVALLLIITMLDPVQEIGTNVKYLVETFSAPSRTFPTSQLFYQDLKRAVNEATESVDVTHIRDNPPGDFGAEAEEYNDTVESWLRKSPTHSARRIISVKSSSMMVWAQHLRELQRELPAYHIRVLDWSIKAPALNMAIIDGKAVFLALTEDVVERTKGFAVENATTAKYFSGYYSNLWTSAIPLEEYLARELSG